MSKVVVQDGRAKLEKPERPISETAVQEIAAPLSDDAVEIADHNARVQELVDQDSPPLTAAERAASVEWVWQPGAGLVRCAER